jgi:hypothetical protein
MAKFIEGKVKRKVLVDLAKRDKPIKDIAKANNISIGTLYNLRKENREIYQKIVEDVKNGVRDRALLTADKSIKYIKNDKLKGSSAKDLSIISKNLYEISTGNKDNNININVNIPTDRKSLEDMILGNDPVIVDTTVIKNDTANEEKTTGI